MRFFLFAVATALFSLSASASDKVLILTHIVLSGHNGQPTQLIFDPLHYGNPIDIQVENLSIPTSCLFGSRDATAPQRDMDDVIKAAQQEAESALGLRVTRTAVCTVDDGYPDFFSFPTGSGFVQVPWKSLWGESSEIGMWWTSTSRFLVFFAFAGDK